MNKPFIIISHDGGECKVEAFGFKGSACELATKQFEDALGRRKERKLKPEYYERAVVSNQQKVVT